MGRWLILWLLCCSPMVAGAAIVPDASVVKTDPEAPQMPPDLAPKTRVSSPSTPAPQSTPVARPTPQRSPEAPPIPASSSGANSSGNAFGDREADQSPGESRALLPLAPSPISRASSVPLWISLVLFLLIALAGSWLAQQRSGE